MPQKLPTDTKTGKTKRKISLSLHQKLLLFHAKFPNGCIQTKQTEDQDCISYKAFVIPDVKLPSRFFTGHFYVGSKYKVLESSHAGKAENVAVGRAFTFMGIGLRKPGDSKTKKASVCNECGRVWEHEIDGDNSILRTCPECKIKRKIFSKIRIV